MPPINVCSSLRPIKLSPYRANVGSTEAVTRAGWTLGAQPRGEREPDLDVLHHISAEAVSRTGYH